MIYEVHTCPAKAALSIRVPLHMSIRYSINPATHTHKGGAPLKFDQTE